MSLILEALRKSEAERRRGSTPDVAMELPPAQAARPRPAPAWWLAAVVVVGALALAAWWMRRDVPASVPPEPTAEVAPPSAPDVAPPAASPAVVAQPRPPAGEPAQPVVDAPIRAPAPPPAAPPPVAPRSSPVERPAPPAPPAGEIGTDTSRLPPLKLSMHIWDEVPSRRFVILNGQRMAEGDRQGEITVVAIERNGVVVEGEDGARVRVPLP